ncbi:MAG: response regulator [Caldilineaceae bacterium SB0675_bin_29]|uniref:histidine kinase n=1 Tax=Caldilineaceae bacterium SB0675_bin_29 TaxID=2605266 RepID=A0A6B1FYX4_9CHLR|nr:response regulator [Caldilineaceae bacterium SB0675_bin_29]
MEDANYPRRELEALRVRLTMLAEATLRINESLDFDTVLQEVLDNSCALTDARVGVITILDESGGIPFFLAHGLTSTEAEQLWTVQAGREVYEELSKDSTPLRLRDFQGFSRGLGLDEMGLPPSVSPMMSLLTTPIRHMGERVGNIFVGEKKGGKEFTPEDEETLVMFASQAALVIANARRYREERKARADLEALVNTSPVGVVVFNARTGEPVSINQEAIRIVSDLLVPDRSAEELLNVLTVRRADGREISLTELPLAHVLSASTTVRAEEIEILAPDGRSVTTLINATPIHSEEGAVESVVVTLQDLTPLEEIERMRAGFLGMVSHELRRPLTSIKGSAATLLEASSDLAPAESKQFHRIINEQADYMRSLISDLLDVAHIEMGTLAVDPQPTVVADIIDDARNSFLSEGARSNIRIDLAPDLPLVLAEKRRIVQVLINLLANAAAYSKESSTISVSATPVESHVTFSVIDQGIGVSAERLPNLFRKFSHFSEKDREADGDSSGTGMGLAICKGIVEAHGGRIWVESDGPDLGSRFTFTLPKVEETVERAVVGRSVDMPRMPDNQTRILVVDDDPRTLRYVRDTLTKAGFTPLVTGDPEEALSLFETDRPKLVLLDLMLPGDDGIELMKRFLVIAEVPVIFLSGYDRDETIARAFDLGASDYVVKPFSSTELLARIRAALRRQERPKQIEPFVAGELMIHYGERRVTLGADEVQLTATEYRLLCELAGSAGHVLSHDLLLQRIWGAESVGDTRPLRTVVKTLRRKLRDDANNPNYILTVPRVGYRMAKAATTD